MNQIERYKKNEIKYMLITMFIMIISLVVLFKINGYI